MTFRVRPQLHALVRLLAETVVAHALVGEEVLPSAVKLPWVCFWERVGDDDD